MLRYKLFDTVRKKLKLHKKEYLFDNNVLKSNILRYYMYEIQNVNQSIVQKFFDAIKKSRGKEN